MELKQSLSVLWKWRWLIFAAAVVASLFSYLSSRQTPPVYRTTTTLLVGQSLQSSNPQVQDFATSQQLALSYVQLVRRQPLLQATVDALRLNMPWQSLAQRVSAVAVTGTQLIEITVVDTNPRRAGVIANEIAHQLILLSPTPQEKEQEQHRQFVEQQLTSLQGKINDAEKQIRDLDARLAQETSARSIQDIQNQTTLLQQKITTWQGSYASLLGYYKGSQTNFLSVVEAASIPTAPQGPDALRNALLAAGIGVAVAASGALLAEYLDDTVRTRDDVERVLGLPALASIARVDGTQRHPQQLVTAHDTLSPVAEAYRVLRINIQFASLTSPSGPLLVTSALRNEGKTTVACNLAIIMAQAGKRVIVADADLRRPSVHRLFGLSNRTGLSALLVDESLPLETALADTPTVGLKCLPSGPLPVDPAELLGSDAMGRRLAQMQEWADVIILDSPATLPVADAVILGGLCGAVLLVVAAGRTSSDTARRAKTTLEPVGRKLLGVVLNKVQPDRLGSRHYSLARDPSPFGEQRRRIGRVWTRLLKKRQALSARLWRVGPLTIRRGAGDDR